MNFRNVLLGASMILASEVGCVETYCTEDGKFVVKSTNRQGGDDWG